MDLNTLMNRMKAEDSRNLRISRSFQWIYWIMIPLYSGLLIFSTDGELNHLNRLSGLFYVLSFIVFLIIFRKNTKEFKQIDYSLPTKVMMQKAANRYQILTGRLLLVILALLLMDVGVTLKFYQELTMESGIIRVLWVQAIYIPVMTTALLIGIQVWRVKQKPIRDQALAIVKELEQ